MGIPEYEAKLYEDKVKDGRILISVHTENASERSRARSWSVPARSTFPSR
jgi:hypothetical protein